MHVKGKRTPSHNGVSNDKHKANDKYKVDGKHEVYDMLK